MHANVYIPEEFLTHIESIMPSHLDMASFVASCQKPLRKSIRVNTLKISLEDFLVRAKDKGWELEPVPWCETGFWITADETEAPLGNTAEHMSGLFYIQEASSMMPPQLFSKTKRTIKQFSTPLRLQVLKPLNFTAAAPLAYLET